MPVPPFRRPGGPLLGLLGLLSLIGCAADEPPAPKGPEIARQSVVYGEESRTDYYVSENETLRRITREAIAAPMGEGALDRSDPEDIRIRGSNYGERFNLCESEPFRDQITAAGCSATLIDDDLLLTAGHCINPSDCTGIRYVFDYYYAAEGELETVSEDDVYACESVVSWANADGFDFAIVQVDRPVVGRVPVPVTTSEAALILDQPVWMIGFGSGLPAKLDDGGRVVNGGDEGYPVRFNATVDAFGGNSGSGVFNEDGVVVGILVAGLTDYVDTEEGCSIVNVVAEDSGSGESIVYVRRAVERLCANGHPSERLCPSGTLGLCARCDEAAGCGEGLSCVDTGDLSEVARCAPPCATDEDCRSDHECLDELCLPRWDTECRDGNAAWRSQCGEAGPVAAECSEVQFCDDGDCFDRVDGDLCEMAIELDPVSAVFSGDSGDARADYRSGECGGSGEELVYRFTLEESQFIWAQVTGFDSVAYLRSGDCTAEGAVACNDDAVDLPEGGSQVGAVLEPGEHFLFVDSDGDDGEFEVDFRVLRPCDATCFVGQVECSPDAALVRTCVEGEDTCPAWETTVDCSELEVCFEAECVDRIDGDICANVLPLEPITQTITGELTGPTRADYSGSCAGAGRDLVFEMQVEEPIRWLATASGFDTVLHVRETNCESLDAEVACNDDNSTVAGRGSLINTVLDPGTHYVFVDAYGSGATGEFELETTVDCAYECEPDELDCFDGAVARCVVPDEGCPYWVEETACGFTELCVEGACAARSAGDFCVNATRIDGVSQTLTGDMEDGYVHDYRGSCAGRGPDRVYSVSLDEPSAVTLSATGYDTVLYLRTACADSDTEVACNDDGGGLPGYGSFLETTLEAGRYYLVVDSFNNSVGEYEVEVVIEPVGCGDDCADVGSDADLGVDVGTDVEPDVFEDTAPDAPADTSPDVDAAPDSDGGDAPPDADLGDVDAADADAADADPDGSDAGDDVADLGPDTEDAADLGDDTTPPDVEPDADAGTDAEEDAVEADVVQEDGGEDSTETDTAETGTDAAPADSTGGDESDGSASGSSRGSSRGCSASTQRVPSWPLALIGWFAFRRRRDR